MLTQLSLAFFKFVYTFCVLGGQHNVAVGAGLDDELVDPFPLVGDVPLVEGPVVGGRH